MSLLIRGGMLMTMTERGSFRGDILISGDIIQQVDAHIPVEECRQLNVIDAEGLYVLPGMIDVMVYDGGFDQLHIRDTAIASGITTILIHNADGHGTLMDATESIFHTLRTCSPDAFSDEQLLSCLEQSAAGGLPLACEINSVRQCQRVLEAANETRMSPILLNLLNCESQIEAIAESRCPVVIGVRRNRSGQPWKMAAQLDALGTLVAISCCHPCAPLKMLPVCAGLCVRDGMARHRALQTIIENPARMLGLHDRGHISNGARADLALFDGDPVLLASSLVMTISGGRIIHR